MENEKKIYFPSIYKLNKEDQKIYFQSITGKEDVEDLIFYVSKCNDKCYINKSGVCIDVTRNAIRSKHLESKSLKPDKYTTVRINGKTNNLHQLLARTFISNDKGKVVNHIDGNKSNFDLSNLEVVTHGENNSHAILNRLNPSTIYPVRPIVVNVDGRDIFFKSMKEASLYLNLTVIQLFRIINNKNGKYKNNITISYL